MKVTITIELPDGCAPPQVHVATENASDSPTAAPAGGDVDLARAALEDCGVKDPAKVLAQYTPDRVLEVCVWALERKDKVRNLAGLVVAALYRGWKR